MLSRGQRLARRVLGKVHRENEVGYLIFNPPVCPHPTPERVRADVELIDSVFGKENHDHLRRA